MNHKYLNYWKKIVIFPILVILFYLIYVFSMSGNYLEIKMKVNDRGPKPKVVVYWAHHGKIYSAHMCTASKMSNKGIYIFKLPSLERFDTIRLDPDIRSGRRLTIEWIKLKVRHGSEVQIYDLNLSEIRAILDIKRYQSSYAGVGFETLGNDPQFALGIKIPSRSAISIPGIFWALTATLLTYFLWNLSKFKKAREETGKNIIYGIFFFLMIFEAVYYQSHIHPGYPPDELAHYEYVKYVKDHLNFIPDFSQMPHYLSHPPLYYVLGAANTDISLSRTESIMNIRALSVAIFSLTVLLTLYLGYRSGMGILGDFVFLSFLASMPMYAYIGASVNNDVLALLGGIIFLLGFERMVRGQNTWKTVSMLGFGAFLSYFSKLTTALLVFFAFAFYLFYAWRQKRVPRLGKKGWLVLTLFLLPAVCYQIEVISTYHALIPTYDVTHPADFLKSGFYVSPQNRVVLSLNQWFSRLLHNILTGWFGILSHHSFAHTSWTGVWGLLALHVMAVSALFMPCERRGESYSFCLTGKLAILALFAVMMVQFFFSYHVHLRQGYLGGLQTRYLLPFMPGFAILASLFAVRFEKYFWWRIAVILICIYALYSNFFYLLLYYR